MNKSTKNKKIQFKTKKCNSSPILNKGEFLHLILNHAQRGAVAKRHTSEMEHKYFADIQECIKNTTIYLPGQKEPRECYGHEEIDSLFCVVKDIDSVSAIFKYGKHDKCAVLNFASYKNPGGKFYEGSSAQEESLCHESFLYNVLKEFEQNYYEVNRKDLNKALYKNAALYTPNVVFERDSSFIKCDVLTCAAPNKKAAQKYIGVSNKENIDALASRIRFILNVAAEQKVNTLILGAFGCGVFGQKPNEVASLFYGILNTYFQDVFNLIVFAIPDRESENYKAFAEMFA